MFEQTENVQSLKGMTVFMGVCFGCFYEIQCNFLYMCEHIKKSMLPFFSFEGFERYFLGVKTSKKTKRT